MRLDDLSIFQQSKRVPGRVGDGPVDVHDEQFHKPLKAAPLTHTSSALTSHRHHIETGWGGLTYAQEADS